GAACRRCGFGRRRKRRTLTDRSGQCQEAQQGCRHHRAVSHIPLPSTLTRLCALTRVCSYKPSTVSVGLRKGDRKTSRSVRNAASNSPLCSESERPPPSRPCAERADQS